MAELKPCPFCGSEYVAYMVTNDGTFGEIGFVCCRACSAKGAFKLIRNDTDDANKQAIEAWNWRA